MPSKKVNAHFFYNQRALTFRYLKIFQILLFDEGFWVSGQILCIRYPYSSFFFEITLDLLSVIFGEQIIINEIIFRAPSIKILSPPDGQSNYNIFKETVDKLLWKPLLKRQPLI